MFLYIVQIFLPRYFKRIWNQEFINQMEQVRKDLHNEFPKNPEIVNKRVDEAYERWLKK